MKSKNISTNMMSLLTVEFLGNKSQILYSNLFPCQNFQINLEISQAFFFDKNHFFIFT